QAPYPFVSLGKSSPSFAPEHIPWLAGPVSIPGRTAGRALFGLRMQFITGSGGCQWAAGLCNITVMLHLLPPFRPFTSQGSLFRDFFRPFPLLPPASMPKDPPTRIIFSAVCCTLPCNNCPISRRE